jgi:hypothetical protein
MSAHWVHYRWTLCIEKSPEYNLSMIGAIMKTFLVASDGSAAAEKAGDFAANRAKQEQARLVFVKR